MKRNIKQKVIKFSFLFLFLFSLIKCFCLSVNETDLENFDIKFEKAENNQKKVTISGKLLDSALWISDCKIKYDKNKVYIDINKSVKKTNQSLDFYCQFLMDADCNEIYIGNMLFWTSSIKSYFSGNNFSYPLNFNNKYNYKMKNVSCPSEEAVQENRKMIDKFFKYLKKNYTMSLCRRFCAYSNAYSFSNPSMYEKNGKLYFSVKVEAFYENPKAQNGKVKKVGKCDIYALEKELVFDYDDYRDCGWIY